jgi:hypothetical protein
LLETKCYSCHNASKQKGKLRLDEPQWIMKGGEEGAALIAGNANESELIKRLLLPRQHEDHMPPKEKPQLSEKEISLLHWWISAGAPFDKQVKDLAQSEKIKPVLLSLQAATAGAAKEVSYVPEKTVSKANEAAIEKLTERGAVVSPVAQNSNYLSVSFVAVQNLSDADMKLLLPLKEQLVWLKLGDKRVTDVALTAISQCTQLTRLNLEHTAITDNGLASLNTLINLRYLNLVGTKVTGNGVMVLQKLPQLQALYLYQTAVAANEYPRLVKAFPKATLDTGGYRVPVLESDTTKYVMPVK